MKRLLISIAVLALIVVPQFVLGSDLDDLKAAYNQTIKAWNSQDAEILASLSYPGFIEIERDSPFAFEFPIENADIAILDVLHNWFSTLEFLKVTSINCKFRVIGDTGIMWGYYSAEIKPKDGPVHTEYARETQTWVKSKGKWLLLIKHISPIPSGN